MSAPVGSSIQRAYHSGDLTAVAASTVAEVTIFYDPQDEVKTPDGPQVPVLMSSLRSLVLIDNSGSTSFDGILETEKAVANAMIPNNVVSWDTKAVLMPHTKLALALEGEESIQPCSGTHPSCIFKDPVVLRELHAAKVVAFMTDGEVDSNQVMEFSKDCSDHFGHTALLLCMLVGDRGVVRSYSEYCKPPGAQDISVFAPLLAFPSAMLLHCDSGATKELRVMMVSAGLRKQMADYAWKFDDNRMHQELVGLDNATWEDLPKVTVQELLLLRTTRIPDYKPLRQGYRLLSNGKAFNPEALLSITSAVFDSIEWEWMALNFSPIALLAKNEGLIPRLRSWVMAQQRLINDKVLERKDELAKALCPFNTKRDSLFSNVRSLMDAIRDGPTDTLRALLRDAMQKVATHERGREDEFKNDPEMLRLLAYRVDVQSMLAALQSFEASSYSSADVLRNLGNRAMRAAVVEEPDTVASLDAVDWTGAPTAKCSVCWDEAPVCMVLRKGSGPASAKEAVELNGSDYCMNFPLACGAQNVQFMSPDVYCKGCAQYLWDNGRKDTHRVDMVGILPVISWWSPQNKVYFRKTLAHSLSDGRELPHLFLLFFALLDAVTSKEWTSDYRHLLQYTQLEMEENITATTNFRETGRRVNLGIAMDVMVHNPTDLMRQPIQAVFVILRHGCLMHFNLEQLDETLPEDVTQHLSRRYLRVMVEKWCSEMRLKTGESEVDRFAREAEIGRELLGALFDCTELGIPKMDSGRIVHDPPISDTTTPRPRILSRLMPDKLRHEIHTEWARLWAACTATIPTGGVPAIVLDSTTTRLLLALVGQAYDPLEKVLARKEFEDVDVDIGAPPPLNNEPTIFALNEFMFKVLPRREDSDHVDMPEDEIPPYATLHGPSVLKCGCGLTFFAHIRDMETLNARELTEEIRRARKVHFDTFYGDEHPSEESLHINVHRTAASVVRHFYPLSTTPNNNVPGGSVNNVPLVPTRTLVLETLKLLYRRALNGKHGNVFRPEIIGHVAAALSDYLDLWNNEHNRYRAEPTVVGLAQRKCLSFYEKVRLELGVRFLQGVTMDQFRRATDRLSNLKVSEVDASLRAPLSDEEARLVFPAHALKTLRK